METLQWKATHIRTYGQHELEFMGLRIKRGHKVWYVGMEDKSGGVGRGG